MMTTTSDPEEIPRLYGALNERILAKDKEGTIQVYYELLRLGRPLSEIMSRAERAERPLVAFPLPIPWRGQVTTGKSVK